MQRARFTSLPQVRACAAGLALTIGLTACAQVDQGQALAISSRYEVHDTRAEVGQRFLNVVSTLRNTSDETITLKELDFKNGVGMGDVAEIEDVGVVSVDPGRGTPAMPLGDYPSDPPATEVDGECVSRDVAALDGYVLDAGRTAALAIRISLNREGDFSLGEQHIFYETDAGIFQQALGVTRSGEVVATGNIVADESEVRCAARLNAELL